YLENQKMTNRVTSQGYTAWDNIFTGNRYNLRLWFADFKLRLRDCLRAEIKSIAWREGLSSGGGIIGLLIVFATMAFIAARDANNTELLIALAVTVPRQIEMASDVLHFSHGWNDIFAHWTRWGGVVANMRPHADPDFDRRIKFDQIILREGKKLQHCSTVAEALQILLASPTGRINLRGGNGAGKSSLLGSLKSKIKGHAYYWPTGDRLSFAFAKGALLAEAGYGEETIEEEEVEDEVENGALDSSAAKPGFSSGERMLEALQEIVDHTDDAIYLFDEWDANLDPVNRAKADLLVDQLAKRARVIEISHRDRDLGRNSSRDTKKD
ncbi:MAG: ATP-binding cassette domain-containing protein, partial [Limisphaerales bacterium]